MTDNMHFFYLSVNVFSTKVLIGDTIFYVSNWRRDRHFTWSSEPREGLACCSAKGVPSFLGYFKTLSIGPAPGIELATSRSAVNTLYRLSQHCRGTVNCMEQNPDFTIFHSTIFPVLRWKSIDPSIKLFPLRYN